MSAFCQEDMLSIGFLKSQDFISKLFKLFRYLSVNLSSILSTIEKVESDVIPYIKTHKSYLLRFWVENDIIPLYVGSLSHCCLFSYVSFLYSFLDFFKKTNTISIHNSTQIL